MRRKTIAAIVLAMVACCCVFAVTDDYIKGYNQGYADALAGVTNIYEKQASEDLTFKGIWTIKYFVDDFGDFTDDAYISSSILKNGTFTNSATKDSDLSSRIIVDEYGQSYIFLYEYGSTQVTGSSSYPTKYNIKVKLADGTIKEFTGENDHDRLALDYKCMLEFLDVLLAEQPFKIIITEVNDYFADSYNLGTIDPQGFTNAFNEAFPNYDRAYIELLISLL